MPKPNFFQELKRRNVYKVAITYAIVAWLVIQIAVATFPILKLPEWTTTFIVVLFIIGFPIALMLAWAFEMSPEGMVRTTSVEAQENPYPDHKKKPLTSKVAIGVLLLVVAGHFADRRINVAIGVYTQRCNGAVTAATDGTLHLVAGFIGSVIRPVEIHLVVSNRSGNKS